MSESETQPPLSPVGEARREQILRRAIALGGQLRRRRRNRRVAALAVTLIAITLLIPRFNRPPVAKPRMATSVPAIKIPSAFDFAPPLELKRAIRVERIIEDPDIVARYTTTPLPDRVQRIDDEALLATIREAGLHGGLATIGGRERLIMDR